MNHIHCEDVYWDEEGFIYFRDYSDEYEENTPDYAQISFEVWGY